MSEKITGYLLLATGLALMLISAWLIFQTFTGQQPPLTVIHTSGLNLDLSSIAPTSPSASAQLLPAAELDELANLSLTYLLLSFLVSLGYKIASLGIQLIRPVVVKLRQSNPPTP